MIHNPGTYDDDTTGAHEAVITTEGGTTDASDAVITHDGGYDHAAIDNNGMETAGMNDYTSDYDHAAIDNGGMNDYTSDADTNGMMDV